ncbi:helix-turn-helix domain-containing protein [Pantoea agglomerans]|uniref:helix-turn-helix domain-containing protein n=1 Tax=Enterobacter agglomerans TaxID=549 RepID=UPI00104E1F85|nr:helix-turn-helix transcriptional regulator [Pantoea agglomerans]TCZ22828.1 LuxR family transcriptional regulator [Pantoea agglomerans]
MEEFWAVSENYFFMEGLTGLINLKRREKNLSSLALKRITPEDCDRLKFGNKKQYIFHFFSKDFGMRGVYWRLKRINSYSNSSTQIVVCENFYETFKSFESCFKSFKVLRLNEAVEKIGTSDAFRHHSNNTTHACLFSATFGLTGIQKEVMIYLAKGIPVKDIARRLNVTSKTIYSHKHNILAKLNIKSREDYVKLITLFQDAFML